MESCISEPYETVGNSSAGRCSVFGILLDDSNIS